MDAWIISILTSWPALRCKRKFIDKSWQLILLFSLSILCALVPENIGRDRQTYIGIFSTINDYSSTTTIEPFFRIVSTTALSITHSDILTFFFIAFLSIYAKIKFFNKYSPFPFSSFLIFLSYFFIIHELTQIRVGLGLIAFYLSALSWLEQKKTYWLLWGIIGSLTHYSLSIFFLLPIVTSSNSKNILLKSLVFFIISQFFSFFLLDFITYIGSDLGVQKANDYLSLLSQGVFSEINYLPRAIIFTTLIGMCIFSYPRKNNEIQKLLIFSGNFIAISAMAFVSLSQVPVMAYRISDVFLFPMCIIIPIFASNFTSPIKEIIIIAFCSVNIFYLIFYLDFLRPQ